MGLLNKTLSIAKQASKVAIDVAGKKIEETKNKRIDESKKAIENIPYKYKYTISLGDCGGIYIERDSYAVLDSNNKPVFIANGTVLRGRHHFIVRNTEKEEVAKVHKHYVNLSVPILEKDKRTCFIELAGEEPFEMETYVEFKNRQYDVSKKGWNLETSNNLIRETEFKFKKNRGNKPAIVVYKTSAIDRKYILAFDKEEDSVIAVCFAIGIDLIRFSN